MRILVTLVSLSVLLAGATRADEVGCALIVVQGASAETLFFGLLDGQESELVAWQPSGSTARLLHLALPGRLLGSRAGNGATSYVTSIDSAHKVHVFRLSPPGELIPDGTLQPVSEPASVTWTEDAAGVPWLVLTSLAPGERHIEAFRREQRQWHAEGIVQAEDLLTPRAVPGTDSIVCGPWQFRPGHAPTRIPVAGSPELTEIYPRSATALTAFGLDDFVVRTSDDGGAQWRAHPLPWPEGTKFDWQPETIDSAGTAPMMRWVSGGRVVVARFTNGSWTRLADIPVADLSGLSGPALMFGDTLVFVSVCYRTAPGEPDSFRVATIRDGQVETRTITAAPWRSK